MKERKTVDGPDASAIAVLLVVVCGLYVSLPKHGDIWWMDASRHAMNGAFLLDFVRAMPIHNPVSFAYDYYRQWPALTILFYPPLFYVPLAAVYAVAGVSEAAALATELGFLFALAWGAFRLSREWLRPLGALAAALLLIATPEVFFWGQQVMLDVPAYAFVIWAAERYLRYLKAGSRAALFAAVVLAVLAICTKYNAAFFVGVMAIALPLARGWRAIIDRNVLLALLLGAALMIPVLAVFLSFSSYNLDQAETVAAAASRWSVASLTYYIVAMPSVVSWPSLVLASIYVAAVPFARSLRLPRTDAILLSTWVTFGYVFYTMIAVKDPRHIMLVTYPIVLAAVLLLDRMLARFSWRAALPLLFTCGVFASTAYSRPAPFVTGMRQAAEDVARLAPPDSDVAFWGRLDGTFIFAMRAYTNRRDLDIVRLDKVLFKNVAVQFDRGYQDSDLDAQQIAKRLFDLHVQYLVVQTRYGDEFAPIKRLDAALKTDKFKEVERIPMTANYPFSYITSLVIYRLVADVPNGRVAPTIQLKLIGRSIPAKRGSQQGAGR
jgi:4-amino-4-deoxy-L-arabinose transferase-like glycosyltransferase